MLALRDIADIRTGLVLSRKKAAVSNMQPYSYPLMTLKCFSASGTVQHDCIGEFLSAEQIDSQYMTRIGDVVMRLRAPNHAVCIDAHSAGMLLSSLMAVIRMDEAQVNPQFLAYYLNTEIVKKALNSEIKGTTIPMIKTKDIENLSIVLPSLQVQQKAVAYIQLSQKEGRLLEELKQQKKLMAQGVLATIIQQHKEEK